ncbi:hypothetical protein N9Y92_03645, partial [Chlamydiales bacterium]|nr:hypothetical protein [Chlamydiales bacterium]
MRKFSRAVSVKCCFCFMAVSAVPQYKLYAADNEWIATLPGSDMGVGSNWDLTTVPTLIDNALFDSATIGVDTSPFTTLDLDFLTITFVNDAAPFTYSFANTKLTLQDGLLGINTNATFEMHKTSGTSGQLVFQTDSNVGSGIFNITNTDNSSVMLEGQVNAVGSLTVLDGGVFDISNSGT